MRSDASGTQLIIRTSESFCKNLMMSGVACVPYSVSVTRSRSCSSRYGGGDDTGITRSTHSGDGTNHIAPTVRRGDG